MIKAVRESLLESLEEQLKRFRSVFGFAFFLSIAAIALTYIYKPERLVSVVTVCIICLVFTVGIMTGLVIADAIVKRET